MSRVLILAESGFGKSTSIGKIPELGITGVDPKETLLISCTKKGLPFPGWKKNYINILDDVNNGNYLVSNDPKAIVKTIDHFLKNRPDVKNYIIDDFNYTMQDYYMDNAKSKGYEVFKAIGYDVNLILKACDRVHDAGKNVVVMAHFDVVDQGGIVRFKLKTVGNMVDQYITPEGKFEIVLMGKEFYDERTEKVDKKFVTAYDGQLRGKTPHGMFPDTYIPNDLHYVLERAEEYANQA